MGEGWGEGEKYGISVTYIPLPLIPSRQGRGMGLSTRSSKLVKPDYGNSLIEKGEEKKGDR